MRNQPNSSELIGKIIDAYIAVAVLLPENFEAVWLKITLDTLKEKLASVQLKRLELLRTNEIHFKRIQRTDGIYTNYYVETPSNATPIDSDGEIVKHASAAFDVSITLLENEILKVKNEIFSSATA